MHQKSVHQKFQIQILIMSIVFHVGCEDETFCNVSQIHGKGLILYIVRAVFSLHPWVFITNYCAVFT